MKKEHLKIGLFLGLIGVLIILIHCYITQNSIIEWYEQQYNQLKLENKILEDELGKEREKTLLKSLGEFKLTYYWMGEDEYGDSIARPCDGKHKAIEGHTIAVDPNVIPYGTEVIIDDEVYVAEDCGTAVKGNVIDIFVNEPRQERDIKEVFIYG